MATKPPVWPYNDEDEGPNKVKSSDYKDLIKKSDKQKENE